jgi:hypothetical protein
VETGGQTEHQGSQVPWSITTTRRVPLPRRQSTKPQASIGHQRHVRPDIPQALVHYNDDEAPVTCSSMHRIPVPCAGGQQTDRQTTKKAQDAGQRQQCSQPKAHTIPSTRRKRALPLEQQAETFLHQTRASDTKPRGRIQCRGEHISYR